MSNVTKTISSRFSVMLARAALFSRRSLITFSVLVFILISAPAHSASTLYMWQDASGAISISDNPANAPSDAHLKVMSVYSNPQTVSETDSTETVTPQVPEPSPRIVTQGEFAIQLVEELGLGDEPTAEDAADILTNVLISPRLGQWELDQPMTPELAVRLRELTVAAAEMGRITLSPEQVLLAFDTTAAQLGLTIPETIGSEETSESPYPIAETPALVSVESPPPDIYPYYIWVPVAGGFWWNDFLFPGFFVLNVNQVFLNDHRFFFKDRLVVLDSHNIGRQFRRHIIDHHIERSFVVPNSERVHRHPSTVRSAHDHNRILNPPTRPFERSLVIPNPGRVHRHPSTVRSTHDHNRILNPPARPHQGLYPLGWHPSRIQAERQFSSHRTMTVNPTIRRESLPSHSSGGMPTVTRRFKASRSTASAPLHPPRDTFPRR